MVDVVELWGRHREEEPVTLCAGCLQSFRDAVKHNAALTEHQRIAQEVRDRPLHNFIVPLLPSLPSKREETGND